MNFAVLWLFTKVFFTKIIFFTNSRKFSPSKVSRYTVSIAGEDFFHGFSDGKLNVSVPHDE